ncbi:hypothetical protein GCM10011376_39770 [Nocardioides flavus (ex Wang et al. 2016)]|uniref:DUF4352 domain-containing protein n=1 Tax=Nocardioides flavus (ex Wang et al. 2016) TaxID=2058780 RepID=A0ABQ3HSC9_9ACTN|nr:hypothetical protein [Nocardioides flavus (ex Wang et al. 2016)]GHE19367.1 hypothetical protein GCM10011376_39770 [Nocardioides flavus (ex Wang et al. 2016)]
MRRTLLLTTASAASAALSLAGCTGDDPGAEPEPGPTTTVVTLEPVGTDPGTELSFGESAQLAWRPTQDLTGLLELSVDAVAEQRRTVFDGWAGDEAMAAARPYFVQVTLANVGDTDLGGQDVPLYLRDTDGTLGAPWTLGGDFEPCQSGPLPVPFEPGAEAGMCLVYLVPDGGRVRDLVFEPTEGYDPITWTGDVEEPVRSRKDTKRRGRG